MLQDPSKPTRLLPALWLASTLAVPAASILTPGDTVFAYDLDSNSSFPDPNEAPGKAVDGDLGSKYLNFGKRNSGVIMTPGSSTALSFNLVTANDAEPRDPSSYLLFGTNDAITSTNNSNGLAENWTLIGNGTLSLPAGRGALGTPVNIANPGTFSSYWMVFPTVKDAGAANSMQIAEITLYDGLDGSGTAISTGSPAVATSWDSDFPDGERADFAIDGDPNTKYLNFGQDNSALWVVPSSGPSTVRSFIITTANDAEGRDPSSYRLLGQAGDGTWNLLGEGALSLPSERFTAGAPVVVANDTAYNAYRMEFPTVKDGGENSMQIADIQLYDVIPEPSTPLLTLGALLGLLARRNRR